MVIVERPVSFQQSDQDLVGEGERPGKHLTPGSPGGDPGLLIDSDHRFQQHIAEEEEGPGSLDIIQVVAAAAAGVFIPQRMGV